MLQERNWCSSCSRLVVSGAGIVIVLRCWFPLAAWWRYLFLQLTTANSAEQRKGVKGVTADGGEASNDNCLPERHRACPVPLAHQWNCQGNSGECAPDCRKVVQLIPAMRDFVWLRLCDSRSTLCCSDTSTFHFHQNMFIHAECSKFSHCMYFIAAEWFQAKRDSISMCTTPAQQHLYSCLKSRVGDS